MSEKYKFSADLSSLSDYTDENTGLIAKAIYGTSLFKSGIEYIPGCKGNVKLNPLSHSIYLQAQSCGWTPSGSTHFGQVTVDVCSVKINEPICPSDFEPKWIGQLMSQGSSPEDFPFSKYIVDDKAKNFASEYAYAYWQGNTSTGTGNLALCQGLIQHLSGKTTTYVSTATGVTADEIFNSVERVIAGLNEAAKSAGKLNMYMSVNNFYTFISSLANKNYYNYAKNLDAGMLMVEHPFYPVTIYADGGLRGKNWILLTPAKNMVLCSDGTNEEEELDLWYSRDNKESRIAGAAKLGAAVYIPEFVSHNITELS